MLLLFFAFLLHLFFVTVQPSDAAGEVFQPLPLSAREGRKVTARRGVSARAVGAAECIYVEKSESEIGKY